MPVSPLESRAAALCASAQVSVSHIQQIGSSVVVTCKDEANARKLVNAVHVYEDALRAAGATPPRAEVSPLWPFRVKLSSGRAA